MIFLHKQIIKTTMASSSNIPHWEFPKFTFSTPNQRDEWKTFYIKAVDFLKALNINNESEEDTKKGWKYLQLMFKGEDCQALQTLIDTDTITPEDQKTPMRFLDAIQTTIKEEEHFWHYFNDFFQIYNRNQMKV